ncbi:hypothetical protein ACI2S3_06485 [Ralstonia nicotianae]|uniref:Uncharacterized protein n=1 Tax=Ralstonia nicotianae TaxID=3037696 RepID=A0ABX7ZZW1_9RALS|nr:hypothetical protein [Ralstonia nicotianae]QIK20473.1 hypothetical protein G7968_18500 [Ralstonia solanacearum]QUP60957.1 hypothetical protein GO999_20770 [Ralstonia nicotianae]
MTTFFLRAKRAIVAVALSFAVVPALAVENFLLAAHEQRLAEAQSNVSVAKTDSDRAYALRQQAAELDSLGKSTEALAVIDQALKLVEPARNKDFIATKAGILFSMNDPQGALVLLTPNLEDTRKFAQSQVGSGRTSALSTFTEGFITATFAHIQLEQWRDAIATLADAEAMLEGPSFYAYRSLVYRYIMGRARDASLANARLEKSTAYYTQNDKSHYGALLRLWQGEDTSKEVAALIWRMSGQEQQEACGEALFYTAAYVKFVKGDAASARFMLDHLNRVAPYGSIEWIYGKRVLQ